MKKFAPLFIITAASLWGTIGLFTRALTALGYSAFDLMLSRAATTALALFGYFLIFDRQKLIIRLRDLPLFVVTSLVSSVLFNLCYTQAINRGSTGIAATLLYTSPIFVTLISAVVFKEKITPVKLAALVLSTLGCVLVSGLIGSRTELSPAALLFGIASGLSYGLYSIFSKLGLRRYSPLTFTAYTFAVTTVLIFPFCGGHFVRTSASVGVGGTALLLLFGVATNLIPYICFTTGLNYMEAGRANITATIEPVVATVLGIAVFHETFDLFSATGIVLVLFSAVILNVKPKCSHTKEDSKQ